jgi:hypothetical protein
MRCAPFVRAAIVSAAFASGDGHAQSPSTESAAAPQSQPCSSAAHRQFDFWVGEWEVFSPNGAPAGVSAVRKILNDCVLHETWKSANSGYSGNSHNIFVASTGRWHQTWVDNMGLLRLFDGEFRGRTLVLTTTRQTKAGEDIVRMTFEPLQEGRVRQLVEASRDGGKTWAIEYDLTYVRKTARS